MAHAGAAAATAASAHQETHFIPVGSFVWFKSKQHSWLPAEVAGQTGEELTVLPLHEGKKLQVSWFANLHFLCI